MKLETWPRTPTISNQLSSAQSISAYPSTEKCWQNVSKLEGASTPVLTVDAMQFEGEKLRDPGAVFAKMSLKNRYPLNPSVLLTTHRFVKSHERMTKRLWSTSTNQ